MGYNRENYLRISQEYARKLSDAKNLAAKRLSEIHDRIPAIAQIDGELAGTGLRIMDAISAGKLGLEERIAEIRRSNEKLQAERRRLLEARGYPADYTDVHYDCPKCQDSGYVGRELCSCMRFRLTMAGLESSGIGRLFDSQNFDTFSLKYYQNTPDTYRKMATVLDICSEYAEGFHSETRENLLLLGKTGLGKTHLSTAIAGVVISRGFEVVYESAQNLFDDFSAERFDNGRSGKQVSTERYRECDLLIVDDLGTEIANSFTVSTLYNLLNTRIQSGKPMIVSTNLTVENLQKQYGDRIYSRLIGEFTVLLFTGTDVRMQKRTLGTAE